MGTLLLQADEPTDTIERQMENNNIIKVEFLIKKVLIIKFHIYIPNLAEMASLYLYATNDVATTIATRPSVVMAINAPDFLP